MKKINLIKSVERTPATNLQGMTSLSTTKVRLPLGVVWQPVTVKPHAQLTISDKVENKVTIWTAKLEFLTCEEIDDRGQWAYRCQLLDGRYRLIGNPERPFPIVSVQENMPEKVTENQLNKVSVEWSVPRFIPYISE